VGLSLPAELSVSGSPVTTSGTLSATWAAQPANRVFAGPATGADATPGLRALVAADIPGLPAAQIRNAQEQRLLGWGQFVDSQGSGQLIELGTGFEWDGGNLDLSANLQGWHAVAPSAKQNTLTAGTNITIVGDTISATGGGSGLRPITVGWDAGRVNGVDQGLVVGLRQELRAPYGLSPTAWTLLPKKDSTGNITIEIRTRPFSSGSFAAITDGSPPSISSGARGTATVTTWDAIEDGELIEFEITALTGFVSGATLIIEATEA
jgi:hypothetical protein